MEYALCRSCSSGSPSPPLEAKCATSGSRAASALKGIPPSYLSGPAVGAQHFGIHSLFALPAGMSEQGLLLQGRRIQRVPSVGAGRRLPLVEGKGLSLLLRQTPVRICDLANFRRGCESCTSSLCRSYLLWITHPTSS